MNKVSKKVNNNINKLPEQGYGHSWGFILGWTKYPSRSIAGCVFVKFVSDDCDVNTRNTSLDEDSRGQTNSARSNYCDTWHRYLMY